MISDVVAHKANNQLVSSFELGESKVVESGYNAKVLDAIAVNEEQENDFNYY